MHGLSGINSTSSEELRGELRAQLRSGEARWIQLKGLSAENALHHRALCATLAAIGLNAARGTQVPQLVILDWSTVDECAADGVALFCVIATSLLDRGTRVVVCMPAGSDLAQVVGDALAQAVRAEVTRITVPQTPSQRVQCVTPPVSLGLNSKPAIRGFCEGLSAGLQRRESAERTRKAIMAFATELVLNSLQHAQATSVRATALLYTRRRPQVIEIGLADNGVGITESLVSTPAFARLGHLHDTSVVEFVLDQAASARSMPDSAAASRGGFGQAIKALVETVTASVTIRSGRALLTVGSDGRADYRREAFDHGLGTQVLASIRVGG